MKIIKSDNYTIADISSTRANELVKKYHYSGKVVQNSCIHLGIFREGELLGALQYGPPMNGKKTAEKFSSEDRMLELNRMVMVDEEPRNSESQAISLANKWIRRYTDICWVLSFSDGKEGNCGYIYQATNWKYLGYIVSDSFYELDSNIMHSISVWHKYKENHHLRDTNTTDEILCMEYENVSRISSKQHIYVFPIYKNVKFFFDVKPYPKKNTEIDILFRKWIKKDGNLSNEKISYSDEHLTPIF